MLDVLRRLPLVLGEDTNRVCFLPYCLYGNITANIIQKDIHVLLIELRFDLA